MDRKKATVHVEEERIDETPSAPPVKETVSEIEKTASDLEMWRDRAQRLQAEMENFRKRQQRTAETRVLEERERLLRGFLEVVDNLERALSAGRMDVKSLKQGVSVTYQAATQLLDREGVEPVAAAGELFDPVWHEAVGSVPGRGKVEPGTIVEVMQRGYRLGDRLLRPARVIVAA
jgi:molecular chaperone GrpE